MGIVFHSISQNQAIYPCVSWHNEETITVIFDDNNFIFGIPKGYCGFFSDNDNNNNNKNNNVEISEEKESPLNNEVAAEFFDFCKNHFVSEICKFGIKLKEIKNLINETEFDQLITCMIQDISNQELKHLKNNSKSGLMFYLINRLSFTIFNELFILKKENRIFPKLSQTLFPIIYDFAIYNACIPLERGEENESFSIETYHDLKEECFDFDNLRNFIYFGEYRKHSGTLLHIATYHEMHIYCQLLLSDKFDCDKNNNNKSKSMTPKTITEYLNNAAILKLFNNSNLEEESSFQNNLGEIEKRVEQYYDKLTFVKSFISSNHACIAEESKEMKDNNENKNSKYDGMRRASIEQQKVREKALQIQEFISSCSQNGINIKFSEYLIENGIKQNDNNNDNAMSKFRSIFRTIINNNNVMTDFDSMYFLLFHSILFLIKTVKIPISDDFLIFCFEYAKKIELKSHFLDSSLISLFEKTITDVLEECLNLSNNNSKPNTMNYLWFKLHLQNSDLWLCLDNKGMSLFDKIVLPSVKPSLIKQKKYIYEQIIYIKNENEKTESNKSFDELITVIVSSLCHETHGYIA